MKKIYLIASFGLFLRGNFQQLRVASVTEIIKFELPLLYRNDIHMNGF